jgi:hypothetical protein
MLLVTLEAVRVGGVDVPAGDPSLDAGPPVLLTLDGGLDGLGEGAHPLTVRASGLASRRTTLRIAAATAPAVDAPRPHDPATNLVLSGANLAGAEEAIAWPDVGLTAPTDVHTLPVTAVAAGSVTVAAAALGTLPAGRGPWRLAIRVGDHVYTPFVVLELQP